jgi:hypothetical protein
VVCIDQGPVDHAFLAAADDLCALVGLEVPGNDIGGPSWISTHDDAPHIAAIFGFTHLIASRPVFREALWCSQLALGPQPRFSCVWMPKPN